MFLYLKIITQKRKIYKELIFYFSMEWNEWLGKKVFVQLKSGGFYTGKIIEIDDSSNPLIFISIIDKFGDKVTFVHSEIVKIVEEKYDA